MATASRTAMVADPRAGYDVDFAYQVFLYFQVPADTLGISFEDEVEGESPFGPGRGTPGFAIDACP